MISCFCLNRKSWCEGAIEDFSYVTVCWKHPEGKQWHGGVQCVTDRMVPRRLTYLTQVRASLQAHRTRLLNKLPSPLVTDYALNEMA